LNFQDWAASRGLQTITTVEQARRALLGRGLTALVGVGLLIAAWPGWLGPNFTDLDLARRVGWGLLVDPSLKQTSEWLKEQHQAGRLSADSVGFNMNVEVADYCRWFCPEERGLYDSRIFLFPEAAQPFLEVRSALRDRGRGAEEKGETKWQNLLRENRVHHIVLSYQAGLDKH